MSRVFAYCRVSTLEQTTENQRREIEAAGFTVKPQRLIEEQISGSVAASEPRQPGGCKLKTAPVRPVVAARPAE
ncbi:recombinase family protein, partial [Klebsiella pneumoniae]|uniref:recombinase family protein n=1 Tax=Klebsiella pneumoniae TaxID=573 RepID=UPI0023B2478D